MKSFFKQSPTFVKRSYRGGKVMGEFLHLADAKDGFEPEDWISSFHEAKNPVYVPHGGVSRVIVNGEEKLITDVVEAADYGQGRTDSGVLIKLLDAAERLGIQVHPTREYAARVLSSPYGKTECWYVLGAREMNGQKAAVYFGFREHVTKEYWRELYDTQNVQGMLDALHRFEVEPGQVILIEGGVPHAIDAGCFLLEIQEPSDYTMRTEKVTLAGETLPPERIHYGVGDDLLMDCFDYTPRTREETMARFFLPRREGEKGEICLVTYDDTPYFSLGLVDGGEYSDTSPDCITVVVVEDGGMLEAGGQTAMLCRGDKFFIPANVRFDLKNAHALLCYPPKA